MVDFKALSARVKMQTEGKTAARNAGYIASLIITVGGGKTKIMIDLAQELIDAGKVKSILYLCDSRRLRDNDKDGFPAELEKWGSKQMKAMTELQCYQTTYKWEGEKYDLLLADEVDYAITPQYVKVFFNNTFKYKILVSGTLTAEKKKIVEKIAPIVFRFGMQRAEQDEVINKSEYYIYNFRMTEDESVQYNKLTKKIFLLLKINTPYDDKELQFWIRKRKDFLSKLDSSYLHCRKIMRFLWNKDRNSRVVIFCERTDQADRVCRWSYHGGNEQDDNLTKFQNEEISAISVVSKIKRGINLKKARTAIFEAFSGSTTEFDQRNGRMKRLALTETAFVIFMMPWFQTADEDGETIWKPSVVRTWLDKATDNIPGISFHTLKI